MTVGSEFKRDFIVMFVSIYIISAIFQLIADIDTPYASLGTLFMSLLSSGYYTGFIWLGRKYIKVEKNHE